MPAQASLKPGGCFAQGGQAKFLSSLCPVAIGSRQAPPPCCDTHAFTLLHAEWAASVLYSGRAMLALGQIT